MTHPVLRTTTALTLSLTLLQGGPVSAQGFGVFARPVVQAPAAQGRVILAQATVDCSVDPTAAECNPPQGEGQGDQNAAPPATEPQATPEPAPDAEAPAVDAPAAQEPATDAQTVPEVVQPAEPPAEATTPDQPAPEALPAPDAATTEPATPPADQAEQTQQDGSATPAPDAPAPDAGTQPATDQTQGQSATPPAQSQQGQADQTAPDAQAPVQPEAEAPQAPATEQSAEPNSEAVTPSPAPGAETPVAPSDQSSDEQATPPETATEQPPVPEPAPQPTPDQQAVIDQMMAQPDVAEAVQTLEQAVTPPAATDTTPPPVAAAAAEGGAAPQPTDTTTQTITAETARSSAQDFQTKVTTAAPTTVEKKKGLTDLEKAGLVALGAVAVGMVVANNRVVANSGDRVVVDQGNGNLAVWKDDDALLRQPGVVETTQRYADGSTLTTMARGDGSNIETVRDATGRVLRREIVFADGQRVGIIDDTRPVQPVNVALLPKPRVQPLNLMNETDVAHLRHLLAQAEQPGLGRYSLAQVRGIEQLRALAPELTARPITFATASSAIPPEQAAKLGTLARLMTDIIADNPRALFLVEGHTDAVGAAAYNLALSDRRAESVALALTQVFNVPPENLVVQGYGERFLKVQSSGDEPRNRRVAVRDITWLVDGD